MIRRTRMTNWGTAVATTGVAALLMVALPPSAQASVGTFSYNARGTDHSITNPAPGVCLRTPSATRASNETDGPIEGYSSSSCSGLIRTLRPHESFFGDFNSAKDVS
jgi:hypothetical protein